ncbi:putative glutamate--cysteine ligase 2-3 [Amorphoplanes nipponensis]|uniref:Putative glutamate--cysteine ligase 2 n=1 Tax=Actinoplanes nipponensis TaxID=135950 RepID=A0A919JN21_9ACTN|nr:glutamate--cysteine ligase [Actinoplanes nipponensis]GIE53803.1 putative glutamate--cysteine ligase 2-3 [Actinoplanes nipponensis]
MVLTVGVEEEFLLLDPVTGENAPVVEKVLAGLTGAARAQSRLEVRHSMVEMVTGVCTGLAEVREQLGGLRRAAAESAAATGAALVAIGATPIADPRRTVTDNPRFRAIGRHYGPIAHDPAVCGCHVHVGVSDRELAVRVCDRLRVWLPVVQALTVNSPLFSGADTGHASWRSMQLERWPGLGPAPLHGSGAGYDRTVRTLVASGVMLDESMVLWYARPSATWPTVEVRVGDVGLTVDDAVLVAGLIRGLVGAAVEDVVAGRPAPEVPDHVLRAAHWNAAHAGLAGTLLDPVRGVARPAWDLVGELVAAVTPVLARHGDLAGTHDGLQRLRRTGTGAERQRRILGRTGDVPATLTELARLTVS